MCEHEFLQECLVESDPLAVVSHRNRRRKSLLVSLLIEAAILAVLVLVPLAVPGKLSRSVTMVPLPPYHGSAGHAAVPHNSSGKHFLGMKLPNLVLKAPVRIRNVPATTDDSPPTLGPFLVSQGNLSGAPLGPQIPGGGNAAAQPPRPSSVEKVRSPIKVSEGPEEARLIEKIIPVYPELARSLRISGVVQLRAIIGQDGKVRSIEVLSGNPFLVGAAVEAVRRWRYAPLLLSGKPQEVETFITVDFVLKN